MSQLQLQKSHTTKNQQVTDDTATRLSGIPADRRGQPAGQLQLTAPQVVSSLGKKPMIRAASFEPETPAPSSKCLRKDTL